MKFSEKLKSIRKTEGYTQKKLAEVLDSSEISIRNYEAARKSPNNKFVSRLCRLFPQYTYWLMTDDDRDINTLKSELSNKIPVLSWIQAGMLANKKACFDEFKPFNGNSIVADYKVSDSAFALIVGDDKMESTNHKFHTPVSARLVVDPELDLIDDSLIIAKFNNKIIYKHYTTDMGKRFLSSVNPEYPAIEITDNDDFIYIGSIVEINTINKVR